MLMLETIQPTEKILQGLSGMGTGVALAVLVRRQTAMTQHAKDMINVMRPAG